MSNNYRIVGKTVFIELTMRDGTRLTTTISVEDLFAVDNMFSRLCATRTARSREQSFRVLGRLNGSGRNGKVMLLHRFITKASEQQQVDHIDNNQLNNCRHNLRLVTNQQNCQNRAGAYTNSKSGVRGVYWNKGNNKWVACIKINYKYKHLGCFLTVEEAEAVVKKARAEFMPYSKEGTEEEAV